MINWSEDRFQGALFGLACGDAVGTAVEFEPPDKVKLHPVTDMTGGGRFKLEKGQWTDDTSMALCIAQSLVDKKGYDPFDIMNRFVKWWKEGYMSSKKTCFDIGNATKKALKKYLSHGCKNPFCGSEDFGSSGNGSLMRLAPVPLFYCQNIPHSISCIDEVSRLTHSSVPCVDSCRYFGLLIIGALQGESKDLLLSPMYLPKGLQTSYWELNPLCQEVSEVAMGSYKNRDPPKIVGSGYVVKTLEAALWAFFNSSSFEEGCLKVVNLGDDSDTTGAVYGQLAGAYYGKSGIPSKWLKWLSYSELIEYLSHRIFELSHEYGQNSLKQFTPQYRNHCSPPSSPTSLASNSTPNLINLDSSSSSSSASLSSISSSSSLSSVSSSTSSSNSQKKHRKHQKEISNFYDPNQNSSPILHKRSSSAQDQTQSSSETEIKKTSSTQISSSVSVPISSNGFSSPRSSKKNVSSNKNVSGSGIYGESTPPTLTIDENGKVETPSSLNLHAVSTEFKRLRHENRVLKKEIDELKKSFISLMNRNEILEQKIEHMRHMVDD